MSDYSLDDFTESLSRVGLGRGDIAQCIIAWGERGDYAEWSGGFVLRLTLRGRDRITGFTWSSSGPGDRTTHRSFRYVYVTGWCDTTGWGCQDGAHVYPLGYETPMLDDIRQTHTRVDSLAFPTAFPTEWDTDPIDLNRWIAGQIESPNDDVRA